MRRKSAGLSDPAAVAVKRYKAELEIIQQVPFQLTEPHMKTQIQGRNTDIVTSTNEVQGGIDYTTIREIVN